MRNRLTRAAAAMACGALAAALALTLLSGAHPAAQGRGRGANAGPAEPTPRLADGTPNLGRVPGEKGVWNVPYITNMADTAPDSPVA